MNGALSGCLLTGRNASPAALAPGAAATIAIRPEDIRVGPDDAAARVAALGDDGSNDLIVSDVIRTGELQAWLLAEHLVDTPLVRA